MPRRPAPALVVMVVNAIVAGLSIVGGLWIVAAGVAAEAVDTRRVLFVGNSLTYTHDVPALVAAMAASRGDRLDQTTVALPNFGLEDHWTQGEARRLIARGGWDVVVLQQGPSALPESRRVLVDYARRFAAEIRAAGAAPALYAPWPARDREGDFPAVAASYRAAAAEVGGACWAAGDLWRAAWAQDASLELYGPDGFHPSPAGSYAAALVIYTGIFKRSPRGLPAALMLPGNRAFDVQPRVAALLQSVAPQTAPDTDPQPRAP